MTEQLPAKLPRLKRIERQLLERVMRGEKQTAAMAALRPQLTRPSIAASKIMARAHVKQWREFLEAQALDELGVTTHRILSDIVSVKDRCMQAEPVTDREGNPIGEYEFKEHGALKALELLGNYRRMWAKDTQAVAPVGPGLTVIVQNGGQLNVQNNTQQVGVAVNLPKPA